MGHTSEHGSNPEELVVNRNGSSTSTSANGLEPTRFGRRAGPMDPSPEALRLLPLEFVRKHRVLPTSVQGGVVRLAVVEPVDQRVIDDVRLITGLEVLVSYGRELLPGDVEHPDRYPALHRQRETDGLRAPQRVRLGRQEHEPGRKHSGRRDIATVVRVSGAIV